MTVLIDYRKARFDYEILETIEAGIELFGFEVKSLKAKHGSLDGAYVIIRGGEAYVQQMLISPYQEKNTPKEYDPRRHRRLMLQKKEISTLSHLDKGLTIVPISVYSKGNRVKVSIAVVRGKKKYDKRESIKKRETEREMRRTINEH